MNLAFGGRLLLTKQTNALIGKTVPSMFRFLPNRLLKPLYTRNSLRNTPDGFIFSLKNRLATAISSLDWVSSHEASRTGMTGS